MLAFALDAVMGPMCSFELSAQACTALSSFCEHLTAFQPAHVALVPRVGKVLESLGPVLLVVPSQAQRVVEAFFALIDRMHTLQVCFHVLLLLRTATQCSRFASVLFNPACLSQLPRLYVISASASLQYVEARTFRIYTKRHSLQLHA